MATTPTYALPYPLPSAPVAAGADDIKALAQRLEAVLPTVAGPTSELAYVERTSSLSVTATTEATAQTVVAAPAITLNGTTAVIVQFFSPNPFSPAVQFSSLSFFLFQDGVSLGYIAQLVTPSASNLSAPVATFTRLTPASGSRTFSIRSCVSAGSAGTGGGLGGTGVARPSFIRVTRA